MKPGNVLLATDGRVLLTDFGIAQVEGDTAMTRTGELVGSVDYLAPERLCGRDPGPSSDLWALGATLYTAVEGRSPFRRTSPLTTMQAVVTEEPLISRLAGPLAPVIAALLAKDAAQRPGAEELEEMLAEAAEGRWPKAAQEYVATQHVDRERKTDTSVSNANGVYPEAAREAIVPGRWCSAPGRSTVPRPGPPCRPRPGAAVRSSSSRWPRSSARGVWWPC